MILENNIYKVTDRQEDETLANIRIVMLPESEIYKAHFPNNPITPGACTVQIVQEQVNKWIGKQIDVRRIVNLKFLEVIIPGQCGELTLSLKIKTQNEDMFHIISDIHDENTCYCKMSIEFA